MELPTEQPNQTSDRLIRPITPKFPSADQAELALTENPQHIEIQLASGQIFRYDELAKKISVGEKSVEIDSPQLDVIFRIMLQYANQPVSIDTLYKYLYAKRAGIRPRTIGQIRGQVCRLRKIVKDLEQTEEICIPIVVNGENPYPNSYKLFLAK